MHLVRSEEMRRIEAYATSQLKVPSLLLMERAGLESARVIDQWARTLCRKPVGRLLSVCVVTGKGNNGGDGLVAARHLRMMGYRVQVLGLFPSALWTGDARTAYDMAKAHGIDVVEYGGDEATLDPILQEADMLVDAILGTGAKGEPREPVSTAIRHIMDADRPIVALDVPTGVDADTGQVASLAVKAHCTLTFGIAKRGLYQYPGAAYAGRIETVPIGLANEAVASVDPRAQLVTLDRVRSTLGERTQDGHKGTFGHVLVIGGSRRMAGAALLCGLGAYRSGCGLVSLALPLPTASHLIGRVPELLLAEVDAVDGEWSTATSVHLRVISEGKTMVIGPGLGRFPGDGSWLTDVLSQSKSPVVLDADALNIAADHVAILQSAPSALVLTPHPKEFSRLIGRSVNDVQSHRLEFAEEFAVTHHVTVVLKGALTVVALPDGRVWVNPTGNAGMATGGSGDVLAGIIGSLLAQGLSADDAAITGAYVHGLAGDYAMQTLGERAMMATNIVDHLATAFLSISSDASYSTPTGGSSTYFLGNA